MMLLHKLIPNSWLHKEVSKELRVKDIVVDSRQAGNGCLFIAVAGLSVDGRDYIDNALKAGANAVLYEAEKLTETQKKNINQIQNTTPDIPIIAVSRLDEKMGYIAAEFFGNPSQSLSVFGLTGTNGKTSCAYLLTQSLQLLGFNSAFIGTIGWGNVNQLESTTHTTPDAINLQRQLAVLVDEGYTHVCMEVSSHALAQGRVNGVEFYGAMFTNLSHDHLDFHKTMQNYAEAKRRLFTQFDLKFIVTNGDDEFGQSLLDGGNAEFIASYGDSGDVTCEELQASQTGIAMWIESDSLDFEIQSSLVGLVNVPNVLLVVTTLLVLGVEVADVQKVIKQLRPAPGRMEMFAGNNDAQEVPVVVVDYAHTPDALKRALLSCREHCSGKLWVVFGCGGDRDHEKRPKMGAIAQQYADNVVITADNSRSEKHEDIFAAIQQGIDVAVTQIEDRAIAIEWAIDKAGINDWVLVAGKGHETTQTHDGVVMPFSDRQWVEHCLGVAA